MSVPQVENMLPSEYTSLWREYVAAFSDLLEPASRDPGFPAAQRLVSAATCSSVPPVAVRAPQCHSPRILLV